MSLLRGLVAFLVFSFAATSAHAKLYNAKCNGCDPQNGADPQVVQILRNYAPIILNNDVVQIQDSVMETNPPNSYFYANWTYESGKFTMTSKGYNYMASTGGTGGSTGGTSSGGWVFLPGGTYTFKCYVGTQEVNCTTGDPIG